MDTEREQRMEALRARVKAKKKPHSLARSRRNSWSARPKLNQPPPKRRMNGTP